MIKKQFILLLLLVGILSSCSEYQKLLKSSDHEKKYEKAIEFYEEGDYYRALQLFDQIIPVYRAQDKSEKLFYYYAYCYYHQEDYLLASYYFKRFAKSFPNSKLAEESWFLSAYCKYKESPIYTLDQSNTKDAIQELQAFINRFPESSRVEKANELIDNLRAKLEQKAYEKGKLYHKMEDYEAAVVTFETLLEDFPGSKYKEESLFYILKSRYLYAKNSIRKKQMERYQSAIEAYDKLIALYPNSKYAKDAKKYYNEAYSFIKSRSEASR